MNEIMFEKSLLYSKCLSSMAAIAVLCSILTQIVMVSGQGRHGSFWNAVSRGLEGEKGEAGGPGL